MIRLHHCHETRSMRVLWLLEELDLPYELVLWPFDKTLRDSSFVTLNPLGRVPVMEIAGEVMTESLAIVQYLCERHPDYGLGRATDDLDRIDWLQWLHFAETIGQHAANLTQQHIVIRDDADRSPLVMRLEAARLARCFAQIEARLSSPIENRDHLLTSGFSAADIATGQAVWMGRHFVGLEDFPETAAWLARLMARPAFARALPPPGAVGLYDRAFYPAWDG